jgi:sodium/potassium/calcium exchanger 6
MNQMRKRDTSDIIIKRPTQVSVPNFSARPHKTADHLLTTNYAPGRPSPEPVSTTTTDDYFTFISANQQQIPEIRLAPDTDHPQPAKPLDIPEPSESSGLHVPKNKYLDFKSSVSISIFVDDVLSTLFPTLQGWSEKTVFAKLSAAIAVPLIFVFTLTLPVAETDDLKVDDMEVAVPEGAETEEDDVPQVVINSGVSKSYLTVPIASESMSEIIEEQSGLGWCRWLLALQAICASTFIGCVMACEFLFYFYITIKRNFREANCMNCSYYLISKWIYSWSLHCYFIHSGLWAGWSGHV